jgi:ligand-binding sensor domain-containing protein
VLSFFFSCSALALDPTNHISQYGHTAWKVQDGLFEGTPNSITQTADGYLWLGTESRLFRFDGVRFVLWTPPNGDRLPSPSLNEQLGHAVEELITGDSDDPPLSEEAVVEQ